MENFKDESSDINLVGTPQGGVISPLLCNIALHGLENELLKRFPRYGVKIIRYADDFVVFCRTIEDIKKAKQIVVDFLGTVNLKLSVEKTSIRHSMTPLEEGGRYSKPGLDFLGYHFRNYETTVNRGVRTTRGAKQEFVQISMPSKDSVTNHKRAIKNILRKYKSAPRESVIAKLAERIQGWTRYQSVTKCSKYFSYLDKWLF